MKAAVGVPAARNEPRTENEVGLGGRGQQVRDVFRGVGEIGVHFDDEISAEGQGGPQAVDAAGAAAAALLPDQGVNAGISRRPLLGPAARAVRGIVVGHDNADIGVQGKGKDRLDHVGDILPLVVCREHHR
ncbi:MAG: hypothetical protein BWX98_02657 [Candidatus Aminicenantes bacterium ADurb.Bin147]|nr:MAG: hypothetical protein BWX98_02657 [Candidatus Aminicenantes bacterium ADurb.Bin147]